MEHFKSPFDPRELTSARAMENRRFLDDVLERCRSHRYFSHSFMSELVAAAPSPEGVTFVLTTMYKLVSPFTSLLCSLGGQAPTLRSRFALLDNIYEEMGCGNFEAAHPSLYLKMLASIGISENAAEMMPTLPSIRRVNDHLRETVERRHFAVACSMLALAEAVIPPTFPILVTVARGAFPEIDMTFFDRHGPRDEAHSDDASILFAMNADSSHYEEVEIEVRRALDYRTDVFDDWVAGATRGMVEARGAISERPRLRSERPRPLSVRPRAISERPRAISERPRPLSVPPPSHHSVRPTG